MLSMIILGIFLKVIILFHFFVSLLHENTFYILGHITKQHFMLNQLGKHQVKDMNVYIEPLIDKLLKLWAGITMYDISRPIWKRKFQFHGKFMMPPG